MFGNWKAREVLVGGAVGSVVATDSLDGAEKDKIRQQRCFKKYANMKLSQ